MADATPKRIIQLEELTTLSGTEYIVVDDGTTGTRKYLLSNLSGGGGSVTVDSALSGSSENPVQNKVIYTALGNKQDSLTFDNAPTNNSNNPVKSGGIYTALGGKIDLPSSPSSGDFLVYNGSAWVAQSLSVWQGGNY